MVGPENSQAILLHFYSTQGQERVAPPARIVLRIKVDFEMKAFLGQLFTPAQYVSVEQHAFARRESTKWNALVRLSQFDI